MDYLAPRPMAAQLAEVLLNAINDEGCEDFEVRVSKVNSTVPKIAWEIVDIDIDEEDEKIYIQVGARI